MKVQGRGGAVGCLAVAVESLKVGSEDVLNSLLQGVAGYVGRGVGPSASLLLGLAALVAKGAEYLHNFLRTLIDS